MEDALILIAYLKRKTNSMMVFDPTYPEINQEHFKTYDWARHYGDVEEAIPIDRP